MKVRKYRKGMKVPDGALVISNLDVGDASFDCDVGSWNVTRARRDCAQGKHRTYTFEVAEVLALNKTVEVDEAKVSAMVADEQRLLRAPPLIFAMENGALWLIDGHHRLRALAQIGKRDFVAHVIEEKDSRPYRLYFNGKRISPWYEKTKAQRR